MSGMRTLFLAWQDQGPARAWYPIGRFDADVEESLYRFQYIHGAKRAEQEAGFKPLLAFTSFDEVYESNSLFPLFSNRVMSPKRQDFAEYVRWLSLDESNADPIEILTVSGGTRQTDNLEVFPRIEKRDDNTFRCRFFLHGMRHLSEASRLQAETLESDAPLQVSLEANNPATGTAITLMSEDYVMLGWAPRYLVADFKKSIAHNLPVSARVVQVNPPPAPLNQRVLVEFTRTLP